MNVCDCGTWKKYYYQIAGATVIAVVHSVPCKWPDFTYCPWCGKKLHREDVYGEKK
jgi:hypothetical protein